MLMCHYQLRYFFAQCSPFHFHLIWLLQHNLLRPLSSQMTLSVLVLPRAEENIAQNVVVPMEYQRWYTHWQLWKSRQTPTSFLPPNAKHRAQTIELFPVPECKLNLPHSLFDLGRLNSCTKWYNNILFHKKKQFCLALKMFSTAHFCWTATHHSGQLWHWVSVCNVQPRDCMSGHRKKSITSQTMISQIFCKAFLVSM